ncbi:MAG TPA: DALR domain-containing protein, partial [Candidatus Tectomicrobia bacterium]
GIRLYLAGHHYRQAWEHDDHSLAAAEGLAQHVRAAAAVTGGLQSAGVLATEAMWAAFIAAIEDDLHTERAIQVLRELADMILTAAQERQHVQQAQHTLYTCGHMLGLCLNATAPEPRVLRGWEAHLARFRESEAFSG